jgi:hypothetical protein
VPNETHWFRQLITGIRHRWLTPRLPEGVEPALLLLNDADTERLTAAHRAAARTLQALDAAYARGEITLDQRLEGHEKMTAELREIEARYAVAPESDHYHEAITLIYPLKQIECRFRPPSTAFLRNLERERVQAPRCFGFTITDRKAFVKSVTDLVARTGGRPIEGERLKTFFLEAIHGGLVQRVDNVPLLMPYEIVVRV